MNRNSRHRLLQRLFWNPIGFSLLRAYRAIARRIEYVLLNRSLHSDTNGEHWLIATLPERPVVVDVGFYQGDFSKDVLAAKSGAQVFAFDPARSAQLEFASHFSDDGNIHFTAAALSSECGTATFRDYGNMCSSLGDRGDAGDLKDSYDVPVLRLDRWCDERALARIDLLKIDAEGFDLDVLKGAEALLDAQRIDTFMFEYADGWIANRTFLADAVAYLSGKPYKLFYLFNGFLVPFAYTHSDERFDLGRMYIGVSETTLVKRPVVYANL